MSHCFAFSQALSAAFCAGIEASPAPSTAKAWLGAGGGREERGEGALSKALFSAYLGSLPPSPREVGLGGTTRSRDLRVNSEVIAARPVEIFFSTPKGLEDHIHRVDTHEVPNLPEELNRLWVARLTSDFRLRLPPLGALLAGADHAAAAEDAAALAASAKVEAQLPRYPSAQKPCGSGSKNG